MSQVNENNLILLIDNHEPFGFHLHDKLPDNHDSRRAIHAKKLERSMEYI